MKTLFWECKVKLVVGKDLSRKIAAIIIKNKATLTKHLTTLTLPILNSEYIMASSDLEFLPRVFKHVVGKDQQPVEETSLSGKLIGFYFSAHWCGPCRQFTPVLAKKYEEFQKSGANFEIIFISADEDDDSANEYFATMPWKMVKFSAREIEEELSKKYQVRGIPSLVLVSSDGSLLTTEGRAIISANIPLDADKIKAYIEEQEAKERRAEEEALALKKNFNCVDVFAADKHPVKDHQGNIVDSATFKGKIVGLYFSAHWCPPCRGFTPVLAGKYNELLKDNKAFEIIFISSDRDDSSAKDYFKEMPWKMLDFNDREGKQLLARVFEISGIPTLVLINSDGSIITDEGREAIMTVEFDKLSNYAEEKRLEEERLNEEIKSMPDEVTVAVHVHPLKKLPTVYRGNYGCDACGSGGSGWVYHCDECGFDVHPRCVKKLLEQSS